MMKYAIYMMQRVSYAAPKMQRVKEMVYERLNSFK
jgi:hypothetical protein